MSFEQPITKEHQEQAHLIPSCWSEAGLTRRDYEQFLADLSTTKTFQAVDWLLETQGFGKDSPFYQVFATNMAVLTLQAQGEVDFGSLQDTFPAVAERVASINQSRQEAVKQFTENTTTLENGSERVPMHLVYGTDESALSETHKPPLVLAPGCFTGPDQLKNFIVALAQLGHTVIAPEMFRPTAETQLQFAEHDVDTLVPNTKVTAAYTSAVEASMQQYEVMQPSAESSYNLIGYSTGASAVIKAALRQPEKIASIVLLNPAGLSNTSESAFMNKLKVATSAVKHMMQNGKFENTPSFQSFCAGYSERQSKRGWREVVDIIDSAGETDLVDAIFTLIHTYGMQIGIIPTEGDKQFDLNAVEAKLQVEAEGNSANTDAQVWPLAGHHTHTTIGRNPESLAELVNDTITTLSESGAKTAALN